MASYNRVIMMGNLTRDPEYKQLTSGQAVCRLGLASNRQFKNKQTGSMIQEVCFVDVDVWGPQAESSNQYLKKGSLVLVEGRLKLDSWTDNDGQKRSKHGIVADRVTFLGANQAGVSTEEVVATANQLEEITERHAKSSSEEKPSKRKSKTIEDSESTGEVKLKDEEPFEDDLPF
ncbi:single-stranded DNA-binding protein [Candidatus Dependentiae bacterium]|nr:single-stranded DNA-binding protein [Candidatus Dependentiae bacterium]MBU4386940.1 single-stranded DNA-binding protein [Candidatus Dependentiae bacterium]MCG2756250.1 single-stranded DNA-binding protein [Candidatus Dependentiae bacterium]